MEIAYEDILGSVSPLFWESKISVIATYSHCKVVVIAAWPYLGYNIAVIHLCKYAPAASICLEIACFLASKIVIH